MTVPFSVINESNLHNTLKTFYAIQSNGKTEVKEDGHIYDIVTESGEIIEIQTRNLSQLKAKIEDILSKEKKLKIVHPVIMTNTIILTDESGCLISKRKSPKKGSIYDIFSELTGICPYLLNKLFTLEIIEINTTEHRVRTAEPVQSKNNKRRIPKNWYKVNKSLDEIISTYTFNSKEDYLNLLPKDLTEEFSAKDLKNLMYAKTKISRKEQKTINVLLWVLKKMELIIHIRTDKKAYIYKINDQEN